VTIIFWTKTPENKFIQLQKNCLIPNVVAVFRRGPS